MTPQRIQLRRTRGWRKPEGAVVVSRPSVYSNPFRAVWSDCSLGGMCWKVEGCGLTVDHLNSKHDAHQVAVDMYREYVHEWLDGEAAVRNLRGRDLACWCAPDQPCHADVLLEIANAPTNGDTE